LGEARVAWLEGETDRLAAGVELPREFVLPGESPGGAALDMARTAVRRAERQLVVLARSGYDLNPAILAYTNRLSSLLFIAARAADQTSGAAPNPAKPR
jgi:cob(I)alamin adenosyltransferase